MKTREVRDMSTEELLKRIEEETENLDNLKFQHASMRIQNTAALKKSRRLIARMKTIIREREMKIGKEPEGVVKQTAGETSEE